MAINLGGATITLGANVAPAKSQITAFSQAVKTILRPVEALRISVSTGDALKEVKALATAAQGILGAIPLKPQVRATGLQKELRQALAAVSGLSVAVDFKPVSQAKLNAAFAGLKTDREVSVSIKGDADAVKKLDDLKQRLSDLKTSAAAAVTVNLSGVTNLTSLLAKQITDLRAIEASIKGTLAQAGAGRSGTGGGSPGITMGPAPAPTGITMLPAGALAQIERDIKIANAQFDRGAISLKTYLTELNRIKGAAATAGQGLAAGSKDAGQLERALTGLNRASQGINTRSINAARADYSALRREFDAGRISAQQFTAGAQAIDARLTAIGRRANLTTAQINALAVAQQRAAREINTVRGNVNPAGLSGNVLNTFRSLPGILGQIGGPLAGVTGGVSSLAGGFGSLLKVAGPVGIAIGAVTVAIGALTAGIAASIGTASEYEQTLADIKALTQPLPAEFERLKIATQDVGKPFGVGMREAAGAVLELNRAGLTASETVGGGLAGALTLARSAGISAGEGAVIATSAMTAFGLAAKDLPGVADVFANFANRTFLGAQDLTLAIAAVGPVAKSSGIDLTRFSGVMATLAQGGFKNMQDAGTSLKTMLLSLNAPTDVAKGYLKALGVSIFDSSGKMKPFETNLANIRAKLIQLTPEAQKDVLRQIFGQDAIRAAEILLSKGPKAIQANTDAMKKQGEAARVARERLDSLKGAQSQLQATMEEVRVKIGTPFLGVLTALTRGVTGLVQGFLNAASGVGSAGLAFQQVRTTSEQALGGLRSIVESVFARIASIWETVLKPVLSVLVTVWTVIQSAATTATTILFNVVSGVFRAIAGVWNGLAKSFGLGSDGIRTTLGGLAGNLSRWAETARAYIGAVGTVAGKLPEAFARAGQSIGLILGGLGKVFGGLAVIGYDTLIKPFVPILSAFRDGFRVAAEFIGKTILSLLTFVADRFRPLIQFFADLGLGIAKSLEGVVKAAAAGIGKVLGNVADSASVELQDRAQREAAAAAQGANGVQTRGATQILGGLKDIRQGYADLKDTVGDFGTESAKVFKGIPDDLERARAAADKLQKQLSAPPAAPTGITTKPPAMQSGTTTLDDLGLGDKTKKKKLTPAEIIAQTNALNAYKIKLDGLNLSELTAEKLLQTRLKDNARLRLVLAEIGQRTRENTAEAKRENAQAERDQATRARLVTRIRDTIAHYKLLADQGKVTADVQRRFGIAFRDFATEVGKLPAPLQTGIRALFEQAKAIENSARAQFEGTKAIKLSGIALQDFRTALRSATGERLRQLEAETRANKDAAAHAAVTAEISRRQRAALTLQGTALADYKKALRSAADARLEQLQVETRANGQDAAHAAVTAEIARRLRVRTQAQKDAAREDKRNTDAAAGLTRQIDDLNERFALQVQQGKVTEESLLSYSQALDKLREKLGTLPEGYRTAAAASFETSASLLTAGQRAADYRSELDKLKTAVGEMSYAELQAAEARVQSNGADAAKLKLIGDELAKRKTLSNSTLAQAQAESGLALAKAATAGLEGEYARRTAAAEGNLSDLYQIELTLGKQIETARNEQARREQAARAVEIGARYQKLLDLEGLTDTQIAALNTALTAELTANDNEYTAQVADNSAKRVAGEIAARDRLNAYLLSVGQALRDTLNQQAQDAATARLTAAESNFAEELAAENLTENQKLQIRLRNGAVLLNLKQQEQNEISRIQNLAESDRYKQAFDAAQKAGTLDLIAAGTSISVRQALEQDHAARVLGIRTATAQAVRDYEISLKRDTGRQMTAADKETAAARLDDAKKITEQELGLLDTYTSKQAEASIAVLNGWIEVYKKFPTAIGGLAIKELEDAIKKINGLRDDQAKKNEKLINTDPDKSRREFGNDLLAVGKPDDRASAEASGRAKFDALRDQYAKLIAEITAALKTYEATADSALTPDERRIRDGLRATQALYVGFAAQIETEATKAGDRAGVAFVNAQSDTLEDKKLALAEAELRLAEAEGRDGSPAYRAGVNAALAYWRARLLGLDKGTDEYVAALTKVADLETKVRQNQGLSFGAVKADFTSARNGGVEALNTALSNTAKGFGQITSPLQVFAAILEKINPAGMILEGMFSVLEEPIKALQEPFKTIGTLLGSVLAPVLELLAPVLEAVASVFVVLYDALADFLKAITFGAINITRRTPGGKTGGTAGDSGAADQFEANANERLELDYQKGLIARREYEQKKLSLLYASLSRQEAAEIKAAEGDGAKIKAIREKYLLAQERAALESADRLSEAYRQIGDSLLGSITGAVRDGLLNSLKTANFGAFRSSFRKNLREAMFEAVVSAAIESSGITAILQPAIKALTDAFQTEGTADDDAAVRGLIEAGGRVESTIARISRALKPLRDRLGITSETTETQQIEVIGNVSAPEVKISLDALGYLSDTISKDIPAHTEAMRAHTAALLGAVGTGIRGTTPALPSYAQDMANLNGKNMTSGGEVLLTAADKILQGANLWSRTAEVHVAAMKEHTAALTAARGGTFAPKR